MNATEKASCKTKKEYAALREFDEKRMNAYNTLLDAVVEAGWVASGEPTVTGRVRYGPDACCS